MIGISIENTLDSKVEDGEEEKDMDIGNDAATNTPYH